MSNRTDFDGVPLTTAPVPNLSDEEFSYFKGTWEAHLLPAITQALGQANVVGGQVLFHRRQYITIITREEAAPSLKSQVERIVAEALREDIRAKISVQFEVGEVVRTGS
ncbi:hypothetical protein F5Y08DRAFT_339303 [Xylaria arbuscula]|nr:hypothetical protein F5Y08DRAFT_339303 [Xylaria arbuscula]